MKNKILSKIIITGLLTAMCVTVGCSETEQNRFGSDENVTKNNEENQTTVAETVAPIYETEKDSTIGDNNFMEYKNFDNFKEPQAGDEIIVMTIQGYGTVKIRLFPDLVPQAVENFVTHAKNGYYDGLTFHRVIGEFMIQGGCPLGTGTGGESIWGSKFNSGMTDRLHHFTGALSYANSGSTATSGSQFYICVNKPLTKSEMDHYLQQGFAFDEETVTKYQEVGGQPFLDQGIFGAPNSGYTVFGQVFEGQNIIETVSKVATGMGDKPTTPVIIESVKVETYQK